MGGTDAKTAQDQAPLSLAQKAPCKIHHVGCVHSYVIFQSMYPEKAKSCTIRKCIEQYSLHA